MILCGTRRKHVQRCKYCSRPATVVCEFKHEDGTGCEAKICGQCMHLGDCRIHRLRGDISITAIPAGNIMEKSNDNAAG